MKPQAVKHVSPNYFREHVIAPYPGGNAFTPIAVVEAGFAATHLTTETEIDLFETRCIAEIKESCERARRALRDAHTRLDREIRARAVQSN